MQWKAMAGLPTIRGDMGSSKSTVTGKLVPRETVQAQQSQKQRSQSQGSLCYCAGEAASATTSMHLRLGLSWCCFLGRCRQSWISGDGLGAAIYTQWNDVETEVNGLLTYDRQSAANGAPYHLRTCACPTWQKQRMCQGHLKLPMEFYQEFSRMVQESARKCMSATRLHSSPQEKHARESAAGAAGAGESLALGVALAPFLVFRCPARSPVCPPTEGSSLWWKTDLLTLWVPAPGILERDSTKYRLGRIAFWLDMAARAQKRLVDAWVTVWQVLSKTRRQGLQCIHVHCSSVEEAPASLTRGAGVVRNGDRSKTRPANVCNTLSMQRTLFRIRSWLEAERLNAFAVRPAARARRRRHSKFNRERKAAATCMGWFSISRLVSRRRDSRKPMEPWWRMEIRITAGRSPKNAGPRNLAAWLGSRCRSRTTC